MKTTNFTIFLFLIVIGVISCERYSSRSLANLYNEVNENPLQNNLTASEKGNGWQLLFDGKTADGWHGYNMKGFPNSWIVEDGSFTIISKGARESQDIITNKKYRDFVLSLEYKLAKGSNSGILFQVAEDPKYKFSYQTGPEFQIIDQANWRNPLKNTQINGANYEMYPPMIKPYKPIGEWNRILLVVDGNKVTQMLNGKIVVKYDKNSEDWEKRRINGKWLNFPDWGKYDDGYIALQNHGTRVWFRNIKIKIIK